MGSLAVFCGYWVTYVEFLPPCDDTEQPHHQSAVEQLIGHPERLTNCELSPVEKQLWAELDGIDW